MQGCIAFRIGRFQVLQRMHRKVSSMQLAGRFNASFHFRLALTAPESMRALAASLWPLAAAMWRAAALHRVSAVSQM